jgi:hypothetical protein
MDPMPGITKRFVDTAEPGRHYDDKLPGFGLYVGTSGARSYFLEYRPGRGRGVHKRRISHRQARGAVDASDGTPQGH